MRMPDAVNDRLLPAVTVFQVEIPDKPVIRLFKTFPIRLRAFLTHIEQIQRVVNCLDCFDIFLRLCVEQPGSLIRNLQVVIILLALPVEHRKLWLQHHAEIRNARISRQNDRICFTRMCALRQNNFSVIFVKPLPQDTVYEHTELRIRRIPLPAVGCLNAQDDALSVKTLRHSGRKGKSEIAPLSSGIASRNTAVDFSSVIWLPSGRIRRGIRNIRL